MGDYIIIVDDNPPPILGEACSMELPVELQAKDLTYEEVLEWNDRVKEAIVKKMK